MTDRLNFPRESADDSNWGKFADFVEAHAVGNAVLPASREPTSTDRKTRVDPPHARNDASEGSPEEQTVSQPVHAVPLEDDFDASGMLLAQMRTQGQQLAGLLRQRQQEVDRREANLHAQAGRWEQEIRSARLSWRSGQQKLAQREAALKQQSPAANQQPTPAPDQLNNQILRRVADLSRAEALLAKERDAIRAQHESMQAAREAHRQEVLRQQDELAGRRAHVEAEWEAKRQAAQQQEDRLQAERSELDRVRAELQEAQRETLEMRLATEELWHQLAGKTPPATLTRSIARLRQRVADQYRLARTELADQQEELELLRARLQGHYDQLVARQRETQSWVECRQAELDEQAGQLATREEEIRRQQQQLDDMKDRWQEERQSYQREIRELLAGASRP